MENSQSNFVPLNRQEIIKLDTFTSDKNITSNYLMIEDELEQNIIEDQIKLSYNTILDEISLSNSNFLLFNSSNMKSQSNLNDSFGIWDLFSQIYFIKQYQNEKDDRYIADGIKLLESRNSSRLQNGLYYNTMQSNSSAFLISTLDNLAYMLIDVEIRDIFTDIGFNNASLVSRYNLLNMDSDYLLNLLDDYLYNSTIGLWQSSIYLDDNGVELKKYNKFLNSVNMFALYTYYIGYIYGSSFNFTLFSSIPITLDKIEQNSLSSEFDDFLLYPEYGKTSDHIYLIDQIYYALGILADLFFSDYLYNLGNTALLETIDLDSHKLSDLYSVITLNFQDENNVYRHTLSSATQSKLYFASENLFFTKVFYQFDRYLSNKYSEYGILWAESYVNQNLDAMHSIIHSINSFFLNNQFATTIIGTTSSTQDQYYLSNQFLMLIMYYNILTDIITGSFSIRYLDQSHIGSVNLDVEFYGNRTEQFTRSFDVPFEISLQGIFLIIQDLNGLEIVKEKYSLDQQLQSNFSLPINSYGQNKYTIFLEAENLVLISHQIVINVFNSFIFELENDSYNKTIGKDFSIDTVIKYRDYYNLSFSNILHYSLISAIHNYTDTIDKNNFVKISIPIDGWEYIGQEKFSLQLSSSYFLSKTIQFSHNFVRNTFAYSLNQALEVIQATNKIELNIGILDSDNDLVNQASLKVEVDGEIFSFTTDSSGTVISTLLLEKYINNLSSISIKINKLNFENITIELPVFEISNAIYLNYYPVNLVSNFFETEFSLQISSYDQFGNHLDAILYLDNNETVIRLPVKHIIKLNRNIFNPWEPVTKTGIVNFKEILSSKVVFEIKFDFSLIDLIVLFNFLYVVVVIVKRIGNRKKECKDRVGTWNKIKCWLI
ncbi:MAG: hypothetical protein GPJ54_11050 [Candidatus Heimdallarchaeota archaeon]|nr:hypothetical protein [Candidatus Heimdallarchaeota archaeon]